MPRWEPVDALAHRMDNKPRWKGDVDAECGRKPARGGKGEKCRIESFDMPKYRIESFDIPKYRIEIFDIPKYRDFSIYRNIEISSLWGGKGGISYQRFRFIETSNVR